MLIRYWQPWTDVDTFRRQLDQVFDDLTSTNRNPVDWSPATELRDRGDAFVLRVQLPGLTPEDVDVQVAKKAVSISGEYQQASNPGEKPLYRSEFRYGKFQRMIPLPVAVENDQVTADFTHGILTLTLPKVAEAQNKVVKINLSELKQASSEPSNEVSETTANSESTDN